MTPLGLLLALQRKWKTAVVIGAPAAIIAAFVGWFSISAPYTAYALLKIASTEQRLVFQTAESTSDFHTYRQTQIALIKSRFVLNAALRKPNVAKLASVRQNPNPVQWLQWGITVDSYNSPEILKISMNGEHPEQLEAIVNAVKDAYLEEVVNAERKQRIARLNDLERIFEETEEKVRAKEERVKKLAKQLGTGDMKALTIKQQMALEYFAELRKEHSRVRFELMRNQVGGELIPPAADGITDTDDEVEDSKPVDFDPAAKFNAASQAQLAARRITQLQALIARYEKQVVDQDHPTLKAYRAELNELQALLGQQFTVGSDNTTGPINKGQLSLLKRQEKLLREEVEKYASLVKNIGTSSFELEAMQTEIAQIKSVSDRVGAEMEALRIELRSPARVTLLQEADVPRSRDMTRKKNLTGAAGAGMFGLVCVIIAVLEFRSRRVIEPKEIAETMDLDLLGTLPAMPTNALGIGLGTNESREALWNNALIESVDSIRSILLHDPAASSRKVVMVASATSGEGKTTFACQLAGSLARAGRKTILVDCDLRRPRAHQLLGVPLELGLSEMLSDDLLLDTVIHQTTEPNLQAIPAGRVNEPALKALARDGAKHVFDQLRIDYDFIVVDSSPLLFVADAGALGNTVDGSILVTRQSVSRLPVVSAACDRLEMLGVPVVGTVMVGVESHLGGYGYNYDYNYQYANTQ